MLLKLYKKEDSKWLYWEAWDEDEEIVIHFGEVGQMGETTSIKLPEFQPPDTAIQQHADEARAAGFDEIDNEELFEVIVQYPIKDKPAVPDVERGYQAEEILNECLGWTGIGHCDGQDVGETTLNIYCYVLDPEIAAKTIVEELQNQNLLQDAVVAFQDKTTEEFVVLWPVDFKGIFEY